MSGKVGRGSRKAGASGEAKVTWVRDGMSRGPTLGELMNTPKVWYKFDDGSLDAGVYAQQTWSCDLDEGPSYRLLMLTNDVWFYLAEEPGGATWRWIQCAENFDPADADRPLLKLDTTKPRDPEVIRPVRHEAPRRSKWLR